MVRVICPGTLMSTAEVIPPGNAPVTEEDVTRTGVGEDDASRSDSPAVIGDHGTGSDCDATSGILCIVRHVVVARGAGGGGRSRGSRSDIDVVDQNVFSGVDPNGDKSDGRVGSRSGEVQVKSARIRAIPPSGVVVDRLQYREVSGRKRSGCRELHLNSLTGSMVLVPLFRS